MNIKKRATGHIEEMRYGKLRRKASGQIVPLWGSLTRRRWAGSQVFFMSRD